MHLFFILRLSIFKTGTQNWFSRTSLIWYGSSSLS